MNKKYLLKKQKLGICTYCPEKVIEGKRRCEKHIKTSNEASRLARAKKKKLGICLQCSEKAINGKSRCMNHLTIHNQDYHSTVMAGICPSCGNISEIDIVCEKCKLVSKQYRDNLKSISKCPNHPNENAVAELTVCQKCRWMSNESALRTKYKITLEEYAWMEHNQKRLCASCKEVPENGLVLDHNHKTNKIRSLLCGPCNKLIGHAKEQITRLENAIKYLIKFNV